MRGIRGINEKFEEEEFDFLKEKKGDMSWREFILKSAGYIKKKSLTDKVLGR
jgi:hypothetical protein